MRRCEAEWIADLQALEDRLNDLERQQPCLEVLALLHTPETEGFANGRAFVVRYLTTEQPARGAGEERESTAGK